MKSASDYAAHVRGRLNGLTNEGILTRQSRPIKIWIASGNNRGSITAYQPGLIYHDGAFLRIDEEFYFDAKGVLIRDNYTYHYERPGGYSTTCALNVSSTMKTSFTNRNIISTSAGACPISQRHR